MKTIKSIINDTKDTVELKGLVEVYEELAAEKIQKVRRLILSVRDFYEELSKLSEEIGIDFEHINEFRGKKCAAVFIGANSGLYGDIIDNTLRLFLAFIKTNQADTYVIGKHGQDLMRQTGQQIPYTPIHLSDDTIEENALKNLSQTVIGYQKVILFFGQFKNIAVQTATIKTLPGELLPQTPISSDDLKKIHFHYLYEPTLTDVSDLFINEIFDSLLEQIIRESQLAKFASRLMHLDSTIEKIGKTINSLSKEKRRAHKNSINKKQNNMITGIMVRGL